MAIVENNVVKMEWDKSGWFTFKRRNKSNSDIFVFASKVYPSTTHGEVTVFFTPTTAFLFASNAGKEDEDMWNAKELGGVMKRLYSDSFPYNLEEYVAVIESGEDLCIPFVLDNYGIAEFKEDIEARVKDVRPYGIEKFGWR